VKKDIFLPIKNMDILHNNDTARENKKQQWCALEGRHEKKRDEAL
jgi:hypothetical protein